MTSTPEPDRDRQAPTGPTSRAPADPGSRTDAPPAPGDDTLDRGTFDRVLQPRSPHRLPLGDGVWHQIARAYVWVRLISLAVTVVVVVAASVALTMWAGSPWPWLPGGILAVVLLWAAAITPRQARAYGYRLRADDLVFRHGIMWQRTVAVPYGRMQLVDIAHGPLDRAFGIARLRLVTAAASTRVELPGLDQRAAELLRDTLIAVAETRRTGL